MAKTIYFRGTREQARQIIYGLQAIVVGRARDTYNIARGVFLAMGFAALSDIKDDFIRKARGGAGEDGNKWPPLSKEYLAYQRRFGPGEKARLKRAAGLGAGHRFSPGSVLKTKVIDHVITEKIVQNKGLLTKQQQKRWNQIFASRLARFQLSLPYKEAAARAAKIAWATLKAEGAKTMLEVFGNRTVEILRDTGILFNSLSPGEMNGTGPSATYTKPSSDGGEFQVFDTIANGVIVGTNVPYAAAHNYGGRGIPKRQFLPDDPPQVWQDRWSDAGHEALEIGAEYAFRMGAV